MTIKTFFAIIAVLALVHGVGFVLAPEQVAASYGMAISASTVLMARLFGGALVGLGLIFWFARDGSSESMRGVLIPTIIGNISWIDCGCHGDHGRYAEFNGMGCCFNLSLRSGGVCLFRDGAITSAIVALNAGAVAAAFCWSRPSSDRAHPSALVWSLP